MELDIDLKKEMADLRADISGMMTAVKDLTSEGGKMAYERARETQHHVEHYIEERPLSSVAVAFGAGLAVGTLISLRR